MNGTTGNVSPADPAITASDPEMFAPLGKDETYALRSHLISGWYEQAHHYPQSEPWQETRALIGDLHQARQAARQAEYQPEAEAEAEAELEAGI